MSMIDYEADLIVRGIAIGVVLGAILWGIIGALLYWIIV